MHFLMNLHHMHCALSRMLRVKTGTVLRDIFIAAFYISALIIATSGEIGITNIVALRGSNVMIECAFTTESIFWYRGHNGAISLGQGNYLNPNVSKYGNRLNMSEIREENKFLKFGEQYRNTLSIQSVKLKDADLYLCRERPSKKYDAMYLGVTGDDLICEEFNFGEPLLEGELLTLECRATYEGQWLPVVVCEDAQNQTFTSPSQHDGHLIRSNVSIQIDRAMNGTSIECFLKFRPDDRPEPPSTNTIKYTHVVPTGVNEINSWESDLIIVHYPPIEIRLTPERELADYFPGQMVECISDAYPEPTYEIMQTVGPQDDSTILRGNKIMVHHLMKTGQIIFNCTASNQIHGYNYSTTKSLDFTYDPDVREGKLIAALTILTSLLIATIALTLALLLNKPKTTKYDVSKFYRSAAPGSLDELADANYAASKRTAGQSCEESCSAVERRGPQERYTTLAYRTTRMSDLPLPEYPRVQGNEYLSPKMWTESQESLAANLDDSQNIYTELEASLPPPPDASSMDDGDVFLPPATGRAGLPLPTSPGTPVHSVMTPLQGDNRSPGPTSTSFPLPPLSYPAPTSPVSPYPGEPPSSPPGTAQSPGTGMYQPLQPPAQTPTAQNSPARFVMDLFD